MILFWLEDVALQEWPLAIYQLLCSFEHCLIVDQIKNVQKAKYGLTVL